MRRHRGLLAFGVLLGFAAAAFVAAQPPPILPPPLEGGLPVTEPENLPTEASVLAIATVRVAAIWDDPRLKEFRDGFATNAPVFAANKVRECGVPIDQIERLTIVLFEMSGGDGLGPMQQLNVITPRKPLADEQFAKATESKLVVKRGDLPGQADVALYQNGANAIALTGSQIILIETYTDGPPMRKLTGEMLAKARQRDADRAPPAQKNASVLAIVFDGKTFNNYLEGVIRAEDDEIPEALRPLLKTRVFSIDVSLQTTIGVSVQAAFANAADATAAKPAVEAGLKIAAASLDAQRPGVAGSPVAELLAFAHSVVGHAAVKAEGRTVTATSAGAFTMALQTAVARSVRIFEQDVNKVTTGNNLKLLGVAALNYHESNTTMPVNSMSNAGKPLLSWRVHLLPYLQEEELYKQFKLDEPWDSETNKALIARMPKVFRVPNEKPLADGHTYYQTFVSKKGVSPRAFHVADETAGLSMAKVTDGLSNTIMVVEAAEAVPWTKPIDLPFDAAAKLPMLGGHFDGGFHILLCDGGVRFLKTTVKEATLKAAITVDGGEVVDFDQE